MDNIKILADQADMIVNGYAYTKMQGDFKVFHLDRPEKYAVISSTGDILETNMHAIEVEIVKNYYFKNNNFLFSNE